MSEIQNSLWPGWETVRLIGRGSFGAVYEIQRDVFGEIEKAALKVISIPQNDSDIEELYSDGYDDESIVDTFKSHLRNIVAEYSLMRKMNGCSNVVNCDDVRYVQHDDGVGWDIFIKMELLTPLTKTLPSKFSEELVIKIAQDMCCALELCKKHNIVHRDIKPQNIFVSPNGDYKLGDFGIAKTVEKTMGGTKIGTYKYMAPEVYHYQPYGVTADIYSLGLVLYWLMNERRMPFMPLPPAKPKVSDEEHARERRLSGERLPAPKNGTVELKSIVLKACSYDPKERYQSAQDMWNALAALEKGTVSYALNNLSPSETVEEETETPELIDTLANEYTVGPTWGNAEAGTAETEVQEIEIEDDATLGPVFCGKVAPNLQEPKLQSASLKPKTMPPSVAVDNPPTKEEGNSKQNNTADGIEPPPKKIEAWRASEAAHRQWVKEQKERAEEQPERKGGVAGLLTHAVDYFRDMLPINEPEANAEENSDYRMAAASHQYWSNNQGNGKETNDTTEKEVESWRRSEAAHRQWLKSQEE